MLQRKKLVLSIIFILFIINLWQWWPDAEQTGLQSVHLMNGQISADDLRLFGHEVDDKDIRKVHRDLFVMYKPKTNKKSVSKKRKNTAKIFKSQRNDSGLSQFRLIAVLFKNNIKHAYLLKGDKDYYVKKGDEIEGRYLVEKVTVSAVTLIEINTNKSSIVTMQ